MQRLQSFYFGNVVPYFKQNPEFDNSYKVPRLVKIVINRGFDESCQNSKVLDVLLNEMNLISCQRPCLTYSMRSIASFKVKKGMPVGMRVTLRGEKMYSFLDRLISLSLPRIRDFQGLDPSAFDRFGNYNLGLTDQLMFPEIEFDKVLRLIMLN